MSLPATIGFNEKHVDLRHEFIARLIEMIQQEMKLTSYSIQEDYAGNPCEAVRLESDECTIALQVTRKSI
jgi:hypothetical protein